MTSSIPEEINSTLELVFVSFMFLEDIFASQKILDWLAFSSAHGRHRSIDFGLRHCHAKFVPS